MTITTTKFLSQAETWTTKAILQNSTLELFDKLCTILQIERRDRDHEPQSEREESKQEIAFEEAVRKEARSFVQALESYEVVNQEDLTSLRAMLDR